MRASLLGAGLPTSHGVAAAALAASGGHGPAPRRRQHTPPPPPTGALARLGPPPARGGRQPTSRVATSRPRDRRCSHRPPSSPRGPSAHRRGSPARADGGRPRPRDCVRSSRSLHGCSRPRRQARRSPRRLSHPSRAQSAPSRRPSANPVQAPPPHRQTAGPAQRQLPSSRHLILPRGLRHLDRARGTPAGQVPQVPWYTRARPPRLPAG